MFYLYSVQKRSAECDEIPEAKREWWYLVLSSDNKQKLLDWYNNYRYEHSQGFKIVEATGNLPDFFYPLLEIKRQSNAGKLLRSIKWEQK
jgi:hypothetical protein